MIEARKIHERKMQEDPEYAREYEALEEEFDDMRKLYTVEEVFPDSTPGTRLVGARYKEDMTQEQLAKATGIPRRHISEMENNKRTIDKERAKRMAEVLNVDYRVFL